CKSTVVPVRLAGEQSGGKRKVSYGDARSNSERVAPSACVGRRLSAPQIVWNRSTRRAGDRGRARVDKPRWTAALREQQLEQGSTICRYRTRQNRCRPICLVHKGFYTLATHLISIMNSGNARRRICTMVLATTGVPEKTACRHLTAEAKAASMSVTKST